MSLHQTPELQMSSAMPHQKRWATYLNVTFTIHSVCKRRGKYPRAITFGNVITSARFHAIRHRICEVYDQQCSWHCEKTASLAQCLSDID